MGVGYRNVDITPFDKINEKAEKENKKLPWVQRMEMVKTHFPSVDVIDWKTVFDRDIDVFAAIYGDIIKADGSVPGRSGPKPTVEYKEGTERFRQLLGDDYSEVPFCETFRFLAGKRSLSHVASKTGLSRSKVDRLLRGVEAPTPRQMEQIAKAFSKEPGYFIEYRTDVVIAAIAKKLLEVPEASVKYYRQIGGR